jgi:hypothetical protein
MTGWALLLMLAGPAADAQTVSDPVWSALKDRDVVVQKLDGSDVIGRLIGFDATSVVVAKEDGQVVQVARKEVKGVRARVEAAPLPSGPLAPPPPPAAPPPTGPPRSGVGLLLRPVFCLSKCEGNFFTFGPEIHGKYAGFALRYGRDSGTNILYPDIRFHYEVRLLRQLGITPFLEITPAYQGGSGVHLFELILRPGVRLAFAPIPELLVFLEPFALDLAFFRYVSTPGGDGTNTDFVVRYSLGFGAQYRY